MINKHGVYFMKEFTIDGKPIPASRPRVFRNGGRIYSKKHMEYEAHLLKVLPDHAPEARIEVPVAVSLEFVFPPYKTSAAKANRADLDNLGKIVLDAMTKAQFWADDSLITELHLTKRFAEPGEDPHTVVKYFSIE